MGAKCTTPLDEADFRARKRSSIVYGKYAQQRYAEPDTTRSSARFLAPETRRAGQSLLQIPEEEPRHGYGKRSSPAAYLGHEGAAPAAAGAGAGDNSVYFCKESGKIVWNSKKMASFINMITRVDGKYASYDAQDVARDKFILSPIFNIPSAGPSLRWRLVWSLCDCMDDSASLYLQCCNPKEKMPLCGPLHTKFTLGVTKPRSGNPKKGASAAAAAAAEYSIDMNLSHCFSKSDANWGIQEIISADEAADFIDPKTKCIQAFLHLVLVSSVPPSLSCKPDWPAPKLSAELISEEPRIVLFEDFLSKADCEDLMRLAMPDLQRSRVATGTETPSRTSHGTFLTGRKESEPVVLRVEEKIAQCLKKSEVLRFKSGHRKPLVKSEALQVVRYQKGEFYNEHYDNKAGNASHRAATFMIYLSDVEQGGATYFPRSSGRPGMSDDCNGMASSSHDVFKGKFWNGSHRSPPGLRIYPKQGRAVLFWSRLVTGNEDMASIHAAEAVVEGEKWIMTRWMREIE